MRIEFSFFVLVADSIIGPKSPVEVLVHAFKAGWRQPTPCAHKVVEVPDHQMSESGTQPKVRGEQLGDPGSGIKGLCQTMVNDPSLSNQINGTPVPVQREVWGQLQNWSLGLVFDCRGSRWDKRALEKATPFKDMNLRQR